MKAITKIILTTILLGTFTLAQAEEKNSKSDSKHWENKGPITKAEFLKKQGELFDKMDANKDGTLTPEERKTYWEANKRKKEEKSKK
jgi:hypothetical protein